MARLDRKVREVMGILTSRAASRGHVDSATAPM
jgi:hypothetical protein